VSAGYVSLGKFIPGYIRRVQLWPGKIRLCQVMSW